jgi:galactose mutarotase-like enzyme
MKARTNSFAVRRQQGFDVYSLNNEAVELAVVPELGARIISLKDRRTEREWMWHPPGGLQLFRNSPGDDFSQSPLVGIDECLPTIAACSWQGQELPDHGEVWSVPWQVNAAAWEDGRLETSVRLKILPFTFERTIELQGNEIQISYRLDNHGTEEKHFLWAIHPLLRLQAGDRLDLPASTRELLNGAAWVDAVATAIPEQNHSKIFAAPVTEGLSAVSNHATGDRLEFEWDPTENSTLGLWLTRGGWHGHHHFALEPMNADTDALPQAVERNCCGVVAAAGSVTWQIRLRVGSC